MDWDDNSEPVSKKAMIASAIILITLVAGILYMGLLVFAFVFPTVPETQQIIDESPEGCMLPSNEWTKDIYDACSGYFQEHNLEIIQMPNLKRGLVTTDEFILLKENCAMELNGNWETWSTMEGVTGKCSETQNVLELLPEYSEAYDMFEKHHEDLEEMDEPTSGIQIRK